MAKRKLSDSEGKAILRRWPARSQKLWHCPIANGWWIRAQPPSGSSAAPRLRAPGTALYATQPDGLWLFFGDDAAFADVVSVEVCGSSQNLNDKRIRYTTTLHATVVDIRRQWLLESHEGRDRPRWEVVGTFSAEPAIALQVPVRFLRVLYALPNALYDSWSLQHVPSGHEYFCAHSSLDSYTAQTMQRFLRQMTLPSHFLTVPKGGW